MRAALHVSDKVADKAWAECDDLVNGLWSFSDYLSDTTPLYAAVFAHPHKPKGFRMLVYSGDVDGVRCFGSSLTVVFITSLLLLLCEYRITTGMRDGWHAELDLSHRRH